MLGGVCKVAQSAIIPPESIIGKGDTDVFIAISSSKYLQGFAIKLFGSLNVSPGIQCGG